MNEWKIALAGEWIQTPHFTDITAPESDKKISRLHLASSEQIQQAITLARSGSEQAWQLAPYQRKEILLRVAARLSEQEKTLAEIIVDEAGKPITLAKAEVQRAILTFTTAAEESIRLYGETQDLGVASPGTGKMSLQRRFPLGIISAITPFNFPLNLVAHKLAPALATGNAVLLKPATQTPGAAALLCQFIYEAGWPAQALSFVPCRSSDASPLFTDPRIGLVSFTGSVPVGWKIKSETPRARVTLELGGNAFVLAAPDADASAIIPKLIPAAFGYAGQSCISVQNILVPEAQRSAFIEQLVTAIKKSAAIGPLRDPSTILGPVINAEAADRLESWIDRARKNGARVCCGGNRKGLFIQPTLLTDVPESEPITSDEAFGPVAVVSGYSSFDEALERVNRSRFGLQAGIFTNDWRLIRTAYEKLEVGAVLINEVPTWRIDPMPYGGVKDSGQGREGIRSAMEEMTELKLLVLS